MIFSVYPISASSVFYFPLVTLFMVQMYVKLSIQACQVFHWRRAKVSVIVYKYFIFLYYPRSKDTNTCYPTFCLMGIQHTRDSIYIGKCEVNVNFYGMQVSPSTVAQCGKR